MFYNKDFISIQNSLEYLVVFFFFYFNYSNLTSPFYIVLSSFYHCIFNFNYVVKFDTYIIIWLYYFKFQSFTIFLIVILFHFQFIFQKYIFHIIKYIDSIR